MTSARPYDICVGNRPYDICVRCLPKLGMNVGKVKLQQAFYWWYKTWFEY